MKSWKTKSGYNIIQILSGRSNVFLLTDGNKNILIDTSTIYMRNLLKKRLFKLNISKIDYLILTHSHSDHAGNSHWIKERFKSKVFIQKSESSYLTSGKNVLPKGTTWITRLLVNPLTKMLCSYVSYEPCQYDYLVDQVFDLNSFGFNAILLHTPGHTIGSLSVIVDKEVALVGDTMFGIFRGSVFPPYADDINQMINSWGILLETNCSIFIPSHGSANSRAAVQKEYEKRKS
jgi:glyoxylase-like metal-dependent hydrolase (beta-lactamase superfamily II)